MSVKNIQYHMESAAGSAAGALVVMAIGLTAVAVGNAAMKFARKMMGRKTPNIAGTAKVDQSEEETLAERYYGQAT